MIAFELNKEKKMCVVQKKEPKASGDNMIIKVICASICGTDFRTFMKGSDKIDVPKTLGHEVVGTVVHVGENVKGEIKEGDRVTVAPAIGCGECWTCKQGNTNMCNSLTTIGYQYEGAFSEYMEIPGQAVKMGNVIKISDGISDMAAVLSEPAACALNAQTYLRITEKDTVVIYGSGYIGCVHAELARLAGAKKIIMVEIAKSRAEIAQKMIPDIIMINPSEQNTVEEVMKLTEGRGADVIITALSVPSVHTEAQMIAAKMGRISLFGGIAGESKGFLDSNMIHYNELSVHGVHATTPRLMKQILAYIQQKKLDLEKYVSRVYALSDIEKGFIAIRDENVMKVVVKPVL